MLDHNDRYGLEYTGPAESMSPEDEEKLETILDDSDRFGASFAGAEVDSPQGCDHCRELIYGFSPTMDGLASNTRPWLSYEVESGDDFGATTELFERVLKEASPQLVTAALAYDEKGLSEPERAAQAPYLYVGSNGSFAIANAAFQFKDQAFAIVSALEDPEYLMDELKSNTNNDNVKIDMLTLPAIDLASPGSIAPPSPRMKNPLGGL